MNPVVKFSINVEAIDVISMVGIYFLLWQMDNCYTFLIIRL